ncbi:MAG: SLBB domain-containing protein [Bacteroidetes Order II. Incertae sedis bacterium]|nr:SLBB domain-containing protein [Bacteroidetes Order II. bacterium]
MIHKFSLLILVCMLGGASITYAQPRITPPLSNTQSSSYVFLATPNSITIRTSITGEVRHPGLYEIEKGWRLDELLAAAGGPVLSQRRLQDTRSTRIRISRETENGRIVIYDELYDNMLLSPEDYPVIQQGDWVSVESVVNEGFSKRDLLSVVGLGISAVNLIVTLLK